MSNNPAKTRRVLLGQIGSAHGIRGEVSVRTFTGEPEAIAAYGPLTDKSGARSFKLRVVRVTDKGVIARIDGVTDRNAAEALRNQELWVTRDKLPATQSAEYYHADLVGLTTVNADKKVTGEVVAVHNFGAGDLIEVRFTDNPSTDFIPFTEACVPDVDLETGKITVIPPNAVGEPEPTDTDD
jgi:16S rRNA processing protein RimM